MPGRRCQPPGMNAFETAAFVDDASHLTLREPVPRPVGRECRVIVFFNIENGDMPGVWPAGFFDEIRIDDPTFVRPAQGEAPAVATLDA